MTIIPGAPAVWEQSSLTEIHAGSVEGGPGQAQTICAPQNGACGRGTGPSTFSEQDFCLVAHRCISLPIVDISRIFVQKQAQVHVDSYLTQVLGSRLNDSSGYVRIILPSGLKLIIISVR